MVHWELEEARNWRCSLVTGYCCVFTVGLISVASERQDELMRHL